tara:strand:- start:407 stop:835 length:429 start_codon:yes stop_codon:yes gene_type:complete
MSDNFTAAGIILICGKNKDRILMIHNKEKNSWDFPYGYKDPGECSWYTMKREFQEETGITLPWLNNVRKFSQTNNRRRKFITYIADTDEILRMPNGHVLTTTEHDGWYMPKIKNVLNQKGTCKKVRSCSKKTLLKARKLNFI